MCGQNKSAGYCMDRTVQLMVWTPQYSLHQYRPGYSQGRLGQCWSGIHHSTQLGGNTRIGYSRQLGGNISIDYSTQLAGNTIGQTIAHSQQGILGKTITHSLGGILGQTINCIIQLEGILSKYNVYSSKQKTIRLLFEM